MIEARRILVLAASLLAVAISVVGVGGTAASADEGSPTIVGSPCAPQVGVTVIVDFTLLVDEVRIGCAPGDQPNGFTAMHAAGFTTSSESGPGTVCRIDGLPTQGNPYCWQPSGGFWSYWKAGEGSAWTFSNIGAGSTPLQAGGSMGWSWAPGFRSAEPRVAPDWAPPPPDDGTGGGGDIDPPGQVSVEGEVEAPGAGDAGVAPSSAGPATVPPVATLGGDPAVEGSSETSPVVGGPYPAPGDDGSEELAGGVELGGDDGAGSGSPTGVLAGAGVITAMGAAALLAAQRRSRSARPPHGRGPGPRDGIRGDHPRDVKAG